MTRRKSTTFGFARAAKLMQPRIRSASESRGFSQSRVLTRWAEIAGAEIAAIARPVEVRYGRGGLGATLTVLTTGANAPVLEMQKEALRARINAVYGYNAIAKLRITQTAATGFADGQVAFSGAPPRSDATEDPACRDRAREATRSIADSDLRVALERLGANVMTKPERG